MNDPTWPGSKCVSVTTSNTVDFAQQARLLYIGTGGDIVVVNTDNSTCTFKSVVAGTTLGPFFIKRVNATGTTASDLVAFY